MLICKFKTVEDKKAIVKNRSFSENGATEMLPLETKKMRVETMDGRYIINYNKGFEEKFNFVEDFAEIQLLNRAGFYCKSMANNKENKQKEVLNPFTKAEIITYGLMLDKSISYLVIRNKMIVGILSDRYIPVDPVYIVDITENWLKGKFPESEFVQGFVDDQITSLEYSINDKMTEMSFISKLVNTNIDISEGDIRFRISFSENGFSSIRLDLIIRGIDEEGNVTFVHTLPNSLVMSHKGDASPEKLKKEMENFNVLEATNKLFNRIEELGKMPINDIGRTILNVYENEKKLNLPKKETESKASILKGKSGAGIDVYLALSEIVETQKTSSIVSLLDIEDKKNKVSKINYVKYDY